MQSANGLWPPEFAARYRRQGYWTGQTLGSVLAQWAQRYDSRNALVDGGRRLSYRDLDLQADRLAAGLAKRGMRAGDRVVVQLPNITEFVVLCFALFRLGSLPILAPPGLRRHEISQLCATAEAIAYVVADQYQGFDYLELARDVLNDVRSVREVLVVGESGRYPTLNEIDAPPRSFPLPDAGGVALFLLSGGTTGTPKLIPRTHDDYIYNMRVSAGNAGLDTSSVYLAVLPVTHNFALACPGILGCLDAGGRVVLSASASPDDAFPLIQNEKVTVSALVPALAILWTRMVPLLKFDLSSLRLLQVGGSKLDEDAARRIGPAFGCRLQQSFGMAEGLLCQSRLDDPETILVTTQGRPLSADDEIRIVDEDDQDVGSGEPGELLARGPYTIRSYFRADDCNRESFTADGYFRTGDMARMTADGNLVIVGRRKDVINRGGDKVPAGEVEDHLLTHPGVTEAAVVAMPDSLLGERTCAYVVAAPGHHFSLSDLADLLQARNLAPFKIPDRLEFVSSMPRTSVGKIDKAHLRRDIASRLAAENHQCSG